MKSVWVIESGDYSEYHVVGVFSSKENAETVMVAIKDEDASISEWELHPGVEDLRAGHRLFEVFMLRNGDAEKVYEENLQYSNLSPTAFIWRRSQASVYKGSGIPDCMRASVWAQDATQAIKAANEKRAQLIAIGEWND